VRFVIIGVLWLVVAIALGASGKLQRLRPPGPQLILAALTIALVTAARLSGAFRAWLNRVDLRAVVALHLTRFIGIYFLVLYARGELAYAFAVPAGWGDLLVATAAALILAGWSRLRTRPRLLLVWNAVGLLDILFVVADAARQALIAPASMAPLLRLPLSLLATFLVPLIIGSHLLLFARLRGNGPIGRHVSASAAPTLNLSQISLDEMRAGVDVDLAQHRIAGVYEPVWCVRGNDCDGAGCDFARFISNRNGGAPFERECDFDVGVRVQRRALTRLRVHDVG